MDEHGSYMDAGTNQDNEWTFRAACIRFEPGTVNSDGTFQSGGPYVHANSAHIAVGIQGVHVEADGDLYLDLDGGPISFIAALSDETLTTRGIQFGASGTAAASTLRCYKVGTGKLDLSTQSGWDAVAGDLSNIWCFWATCTTRGVGDPSKAQMALDEVRAATADPTIPNAIAALEARVAALEGAS